MKIQHLVVLILFFGIYGITVYGDSGNANKKSDKDEHEETISLDDLPDAVMATIIAEILREADDLSELDDLREVDGLEIEEIEREYEDGKLVYDVEFEYKDKEVELEISADGKLLKKKVELEDDDEDEEDEDEDENM